MRLGPARPLDTTKTPPGQQIGLDKRLESLLCDLVGGHDVAVDVQAHRGTSVPCSLRELACRYTGLVPDRDPAMTEVVRVEVARPGGLTGPQHRLVGGCLGDPLEDLTLGGAIFERTGRVDSRAVAIRAGQMNLAFPVFVAERGSRSRRPAKSSSPSGGRWSRPAEGRLLDRHEEEAVLSPIASRTLIGNEAANVLIGKSGNDHLEGLAGDDSLDGGKDLDFLDGGGDTDTCTKGETVQNCEA